MNNKIIPWKVDPYDWVKKRWCISPRKLDSYNKLWNIVLAMRDCGKTSIIECIFLLEKNYKYHQVQCYIKREVNTICKGTVEAIESRINYFLPENWQIKLKFKPSGYGTTGFGYVWIKYPDNEEYVPFFVLCALNYRDKKQLCIHSFHDKSYHIKRFIIDEFTLNTKATNQHYCKDEYKEIKNIMGTLSKKSLNKKIKIYAFGNTFSRYTPITAGCGVDSLKIKPGALFTGENYVCWCFTVPEERKKMLEKNPLYIGDTNYYKFAVEGEYFNDNNIKVIPKIPKGFIFRFPFKSDNSYINVYSDISVLHFYLQVENEKTYKKRMAYAVDLNSICDGTISLSRTEMRYFESVAHAFRRNNVYVNKVEAYYIVSDMLSLL